MKYKHLVIDLHTDLMRDYKRKLSDVQTQAFLRKCAKRYLRYKAYTITSERVTKLARIAGYILTQAMFDFVMFKN